ncbi:molybdopterin-dependent oxidoreductase [Enterobacter mori]
MTPVDYTVKSLKEGSIRFAAEQPENGKNHPRNLFIWRSNLLGSSGKGHEFMLKYLLGTEHGIQGKDLGKQGGVKPEEVEWKDNGLDGKLDLVVTLDFRPSTCLYSDIVLPTATWYEKDDMNTRICIRLFIRCLLPLTRRGNPKATGKSTKASPRNF